MDTLHLVNGDSTSEILEKSKVEGDIAIWREMLSEGPINTNVANSEFNKIRNEYLQSVTEIEFGNYKVHFLSQLAKLNDVEEFGNIVLWFEYDLFCQINLLACCSYIFKNFRRDVNYYLICVGESDDGMKTLSDYKPVNYKTLFRNKVELEKSDFSFAHKIWKQYCKGYFDHEVHLSENEKFKYLKAALDQHTFRSRQNGSKWNQIQLKIIDLVKGGINEKRSLIGALLRWQRKETVYGFGDLQYEIYIDEMEQELKNVNSKFG